MFQYKTETDRQEVETEVSLEIYFKQVPGAPVSYPVEEYDKLWNINGETVLFLAVGVAAFGWLLIPKGVIGGIASAVTEMYATVKVILAGVLSLGSVRE